MFNKLVLLSKIIYSCSFLPLMRPAVPEESCAVSGLRHTHYTHYNVDIIFFSVERYPLFLCKFFDFENGCSFWEIMPTYATFIV